MLTVVKVSNKISERSNSVFIFNFEHISQINLIFFVNFEHVFVSWAEDKIYKRT